MISCKKAAWPVLCLAALALVGCADPLGNGPQAGKEGRFSVSFRSREGLSWDTQTQISSLVHTIKLTDGPGAEIKRVDVSAGQTADFTVASGRWTISVYSYLGGVIKAVGFANVNIKPGPNGPISVKMGPPSGGPSQIIFYNIPDLAAWLSGKTVNPAAEPYFVALIVSNFGGNASVEGSLGATLRANNTKYINLDISGCTVDSIEAGAFSGCTNLTSITIPDSVTSVRTPLLSSTLWYSLLL